MNHQNWAAQNFGQGLLNSPGFDKCQKCGKQKQQVHVWGGAWAYACPQCENASLQQAALELMEREQKK